MEMINLVKPIFALWLVLAALAGTALAHIPVIVKKGATQENPVLVKKPEVSYAYYAELAGEPHFYKIEAAKPFHFYVNILVPDYSPDTEAILRHDMSFEIIRGDIALWMEVGSSFEWTRFYEKYGRDHYYMGPEFEADFGRGTYFIKVSNKDNKGRYALAVGKKEKFTPLSLVSAMFKAWSLDRWFFKPPSR